MSRPKTVTDQQIHDAAREVFIAQGPGASVHAIAAKLGVSHAALFQRAGSKRALMMDALCPGRPRALEQLAEPCGEAPRERLRVILIELMGFFQRVVPSLIVIRAAGVPVEELPGAGHGPPPPVEMRRALTDWLDRASASGALAPCNAEVAAESLLGAMEARCFNAYIGGPAFSPGDDAAFIGRIVEGTLSEPHDIQGAP